MDENANVDTQIRGMTCLESINQSLLFLADQAMRHGEYVLASKLRASIAVNQARLEKIKDAAVPSGESGSCRGMYD